MTKAEVKDLCEDNQQLQWWAMVLFAEICEYVDSCKYVGADDNILADYVRYKTTKEFPQLMIQEQLSKIRKKNKDTSS